MNNLEKLKNKFVEVLDAEHGKKVIEAFKDLGIDTIDFVGDNSGSYYGVSKDRFTFHWGLPVGGQEITLEDLLAMKEPEFRAGDKVEVKDKENDFWVDKIFVGYNPLHSDYKFICIGKYDMVNKWRLCRHVPKEYTRQEIADALKINVEDLRIKN